MVGKFISRVEVAFMHALIKIGMLSVRQCLFFALKISHRLRLVDILPFIMLLESAEGNHSCSNHRKSPMQVVHGSFKIIHEYLGIYEQWKSLNARINQDESNYYCCLLHINDDNLVRRLLLDLFWGTPSERSADSLRELIVTMPPINESNDLSNWRIAVNLCVVLVACHSLFHIDGCDFLNSLINNRSDGIYIAMAGFLSVADALNWDWQAKQRIIHDKHYRETRKLGRWLRRKICMFPASERDKALRFFYKDTSEEMQESYEALRLFGRMPNGNNNLELLILRFMTGFKWSASDFRILLALSICDPGRVNIWRKRENNVLSFLAQCLNNFDPSGDFWQNIRSDLGSMFYRYRMSGDNAGFVQMVEFSYLNLGFAYWSVLNKIGKHSIADIVRAILLEDSESFKVEEHLLLNDFISIYSSLRDSI